MTTVQTKVNVQKLVSAIAIAAIVLAGAIQAMQPTLAFYLIAISSALNAGLQIYFGQTNPDVKTAQASSA